MSDERREYRVHWQSKLTKSRGVGLYLTKRKAIAWAKLEDEQWPEIEHWVMHHPPEGEPYKVYPL